jgi:hypothetical protein
MPQEACRVSKSVWEEWKPKILELYIAEGHQLRIVKEMMQCLYSYQLGLTYVLPGWSAGYRKLT